MWTKSLQKPFVSGLKLKSKLRILIALLVLGLPGLLLIFTVLQPWIAPEELFVDFLTAAENSDDCCHVYYGAMSTLGIMLWVATAAICLMSALVFWAQERNKQLIGFAFTAGMLSGWLALDDAFLLHETVFPKLGVAENIVLVVYMVLAIAYAVKSWRVIYSGEFWIFLIAGGAIAVSLFVDIVLHNEASIIVVIEDSAKFIGICCWAGFHIVTLATAHINVAARSST